MTDETLAPFFERLDAAPTSLAFRYRTRYRGFNWTRGRVSRGIRQMADRYRQHGLEPGDAVLLWGPNSPAWAVSFLGCLFAGVVAVPVDVRSRPEFVRGVARETRPRLLLRSRYLPDPALDVATDYLEDVVWTLDQGTSPDFGPPALRPDQMAEILYTSGTTGQPKGVVLTQRNLASVLESTRAIVPAEAAFRLLSVLPLSHIFEQTIGLLLPLDLGMSIVYLDALTPITIQNALRRDRISLVVAVPRLLELFQRSVERGAAGVPLGQIGLRGLVHFGSRLPVVLRRSLAWPARSLIGPGLSYFVVGGAALDPEVERFYAALGVPVIQGYGLTETTGPVTANTFAEQRIGTVGRPLPGQTVRLGPGDEILVQGPNVTPGYFHHFEWTARSFVDGWLKTGDVGSFDAEGFLTIKGRLKDVIVTSAGVNVYPEDVEAVLNRQPGVRDSAVLEWRGRIAAVLLLDEESRRNAWSIVEAANERLAPSQQIQAIVVWPFPDLPRSATLKVKKHEVLARLDEIAGRPAPERIEPATPSSPVRRLVARVSDTPPDRVVPNAQLGLDLKLDSIGRLELAALIEQETGAEVDETHLTASTTVRELERMVESQRVRPARGVASRFAQTRIGCAIRHLLRETIVLPLFHLVVDLEVEGREHVERARGPVILVANHTSYLDPLAILAGLPANRRDRLAPAVWAEYFEPSGPWWLRVVRGALFELIALVFGAFKLPQRRGFRRSVEYAGSLVDQGQDILIFPEGRRSLTGSMGRFREGIGVLVHALRIPVVPVWLDGLGAIMPPPGATIRRRGAAVVRFGAPCTFRDESYVAIAQDLEAAVRCLGAGDATHAVRRA